MFEVLSAILLLTLISLVVYYLMAKVIPRQAFLVLGIAFVLAILVINFFAPGRGFTWDVWQIISVPLSPFGLAIFLIFLALFRIKKGTIERPGPVMLWIAFALLFFLSQPVVAYELTRVLEVEAVEIEIQQKGFGCVDEDCPLTPKREPADAIALLGRNTTEASIPYRTQLQLTDIGDRILYTDTLYDQQRALGRNPLVIICAPPRSNISGTDAQRNEAEDIAQLLQRLGVPRERMSLRGDGYNLHRNAVIVKEVITDANIADRPVILVTSGIRLRRAAQTFRREGIRVIPRPSDFYTFQREGEPKRKLGIPDFLPSLAALEMTNQVIEEYLLTIYYFLRGWLSPVVF